MPNSGIQQPRHVHSSSVLATGFWMDALLLPKPRRASWKTYGGVHRQGDESQRFLLVNRRGMRAERSRATSGLPVHCTKASRAILSGWRLCTSRHCRRRTARGPQGLRCGTPRTGFQRERAKSAVHLQHTHHGMPRAQASRPIRFTIECREVERQACTWIRSPRFQRTL